MLRSPRLGLLGIVAIATLLRVFVFAAGPDLDTDAYGHAVLGRFTWNDPGNLHVHWVWLPLWHFVFGALGAVGLGFQTVRCLDIVLAALIPPLVFVTLRTYREGGSRDAVALLAAAFAGLFPLAITHGQSAEPEALFCVLLLSAAWCIERGARLVASLALAIAVLLRFEAWAVLPAFALASVLCMPAGTPWIARLVRGAVAVVLPGLTIVGYVLLHRAAYDDRWLVFLSENHEFVREARSHAIPGVGPQPSWTWYVASLPFRTAGPVVLLALLGAWRFFRQAPLTYRLVGPWLLAFVTFGWVREQHLGLDRHFFSVIPFYALAMAEGTMLLVEELRRRMPRAGGAALAVALLPVAVLLGFSVHHARAHARVSSVAFAPEREVAALLVAQAPAPGSVYCELVKVEVLSALSSDRFVAAETVRTRAESGQAVTVVDLVVHRDRWPDTWRSVGSSGEIMILAAP